MAKVVLSDRNMAELAAKEFKNIIAEIKSETLLKEGCAITDLVESSAKRKQNFEVTQSAFMEPKKKFEKDKIRLKQTTMPQVMDALKPDL